MNLPELQAKVRQIEIRTRRLVSDLMIGQYQSVFKGQGMANISQATKFVTLTGMSLPDSINPL